MNINNYYFFIFIFIFIFYLLLNIYLFQYNSMLWYSAVSGWGSARHAMAGTFLYCIFNTYHKPTDPKYFNFIQQQVK